MPLLSTTHRRWPEIESFLTRLEAEHTITARIRRFKGREGFWVFLRIPILLLLLFLAFPFGGWGSIFCVFLAACLLVDVLIVVTTHLFSEDRVASVLRFALLNFIGFLSLSLWFAIFLAPVAKYFDPQIQHELEATEIAFAATTTAAVGEMPDPINWRASLICGIGTAVGLYYVVIILAGVLERRAGKPLS